MEQTRIVNADVRVSSSRIVPVCWTGMFCSPQTEELRVFHYCQQRMTQVTVMFKNWFTDH